MLFTLTMFVGLVVNVGQMVNRRVALQLVADAGAWSGATAQAVQLNHYAFWSRLMQNAYTNASGVSFNFRFSECWTGVAAALMVAKANASMLGAVGKFTNAAYGEASSHSLFNIDDLFPGERGNFDFSTMAGPAYGTVLAPARGNILVLPLRKGERLYVGNHEWTRETPDQFAVELATRVTRRLPWTTSKAGSGFESWQCATLLPPTSFRIPMPGFSGYKLLTVGQPYLFVWKVTERQPTRALFFDRFFGPGAVPPMTAVAVAKAVGGDVHKGLSHYRAKMVPVSRYGLTRGIIRDPQARQGRFPPGSGLFRSIVH